MRTDIDFAAHMETVALALRGPPSSKHGNEWRYGTNGSLSIDIKRGTFFNHETKESGGTLAFIRSEKPGTDALDYLAGIGCIKKPRSPNGAAPHEIPYDSASAPFNGVTFKNKSFRIVKTWTYVDENGADLFEVCRQHGETGADGKPVKTYRQRHKVNGEYINNVKGIRQVPYRLPEFINAGAASKAIFITEGEACADAVIALGGAATCNAMGAGKWPDELTPYFKAADVVILPDNDVPGADHGRLVAAKLQGVAKRVRVLELPGLPPKGDIVDWIEAGGTLARLNELAAGAANAAIDGPLPLFPPLPDAEPYPVDAIGRTLSRAANAIAGKVQVPIEIAAQAVLAATSLATCSHGDIMMPFGQTRPLSLFCVTIAPSGDRKTSADIEATWPLARREAVLREENIEALREWRIEHAAWSAEKRKIESGKSYFSQRKADLARLGDEPEKPLEPNLLSDSPTVEGLIKNWPGSHAALGMFSAEGSMFTAGHGMKSTENRGYLVHGMGWQADQKNSRRRRSFCHARTTPFAALDDPARRGERLPFQSVTPRSRTSFAHSGGSPAKHGRQPVL